MSALFTPSRAVEKTKDGSLDLKGAHLFRRDSLDN